MIKNMKINRKIISMKNALLQSKFQLKFIVVYNTEKVKKVLVLKNQ